MSLVPDQRFKKGLLHNTDSSENELHYIAEFGSFHIGIYTYGLMVVNEHVPMMQSAQDTRISFCDNISTWIKKPKLIESGWFSIGTSSTGTDRSIGGPLSRGQVELAEHVASIIEQLARDYRRGGNC